MKRPSKLSMNEIKACKALFTQYAAYTGEINELDIKQVYDILKQLGFTYNTTYINSILTECLKHIVNTNHAQKKHEHTMLYNEFLQFMHIFFNLHDAVNIILMKYLLIYFIHKLIINMYHN